MLEILGKNGSGKTFLANKLFDLGFYRSVNYTTRPKRKNEINDLDYKFITNEEFENLIERNAFYEYAHVFDHYYGTSREIVEQWLNEGKDVLLDIDWQGARQIREQTPDAKGIFIVPPSLEELNRRLVTRATDAPEVIEKRMSKALSEISHYNEYDYVIVNDDFDESLLNMRSIILSNRQKTDKQKHYITEKFGL